MVHRLRTSAGLVLAALALSSCAWASPDSTNISYAPSDGIRVELNDAGTVRVENLMVLTAGEGEDAQLFGAVVNDTSEPVTVTIEAAGAKNEIDADPASVVRLEEETDTFTGDVPPGATTVITLTHMGAFTAHAPVLDGTIPPYDQYLP